MRERPIRDALRVLGTRTDALSRCPVCGKSVKAGHDHVRAWSGTFAHRRCAGYSRRG